MDANTVILEQCHVAPSPGAPAEKLLPLSDFDVIFLRFPLMQSLFFYNFQCSKSHFSETVIPKFKNSLSQALKHFTPLAGKIILPLTSSTTPVSHYISGDSIPLTFAQSDADFIHLTGNHYRDSDDFLDFVPNLPPATYLPDSIKFSVAAFQITHFPNRGICLAFTIHHSIADGASILCFLRAWFSIIKFNSDSILSPKHLPSYDRVGRSVSNETWNHVKKSRRMVHLAVTPRTHNLRALFLLTDNHILSLKKLVQTKNVSTFVIVCAYLWTCFARSAGADEADDDEAQYLACPGDCRARLDPPLPDNYFGNCIAFMVAESTHGKLRGKEGILEAVLAIEEAIRKTFDKNRGGGVDISGFREFKRLDRRRVFMIAGSTRYDQDVGDFGWGMPKKVETMNIDSKESVSLGRSVDPQGIEIGLSRTKVEMDAFVAVFQQGIREASAQQNILLSKI